MGGIGHATLGWLRAFLIQKPIHWSSIAIFSSVCRPEDILRIVPEVNGRAEVIRVDAGLIDPNFEQLALPVLLQKQNIDLYFNTCFAIPAVKTTRFQASVVHDIVFFEQPDFVDEKLRRYLSHGTDLALRRADIVFTVSEYSLARIREYEPIRAWKQNQQRSILRPAITETFRDILLESTLAPRKSATAANENFILYLGSIEEKKGIVVLLDAYSILRRQMAARCPKLILAGGIGGKKINIESALRTRGLQSSVQYLGHVSDQKKVELLRDASTFVFPSFYESFGIPPLEAMACGTPVVASRATSIPEILGDAAIYFEPGDAGGLAVAIESILSNDSVRRRQSGLGKAQALKYRFEEEIAHLIDEFTKLAEFGCQS